MKFHQTQKMLTLAVSVTALMMLSGCGMSERLSRVGTPPKMTQIESPYSKPGYKPVAMPMPTQAAKNVQPNSLWQAGSQTFFKDQRAHSVGDILTVMITIKDDASLKNKTSRVRAGDESSSLPNLLGLEAKLKNVLPDEFDPSALATMSSDSSSSGDGKVEREEEINLKLAAVITQVLPNGNLVIQGHQEVLVNFELRQLQLTGVIRPEDILNNNTISSEKIAEARISYGGKGQITDIQQPRYGQQVFDAVFPF
jgi:flagellar L-ring protein precursor FlgH